MTGAIDKLGLNLKTKLRFDPDAPEQAVGKKIIEDTKQMEKACELQDFSEFAKKEYLRLLEDVVNDGIKKCTQDFYIEVFFLRDKLLRKVYKLVPQIRYSCPAPFYGKDVYSYNYKEGKLELLWSIPEKDLCENPALLPVGIEGSEKLLENIKNFNSGLYFKVYEQLTAKGENL